MTDLPTVDSLVNKVLDFVPKPTAVKATDVTVNNFLHIGSSIKFVNVTIDGLRVEHSIATVSFRDAPLAIKHSKPEERRFSVQLSCADHFGGIKNLLEWYHAVVNANDLLGDTKGDHSLTSWKSLKQNMEVSPDGLLSYTVEQAFPCAWRFEGITSGKIGTFVMEFSYEKCARGKNYNRTERNKVLKADAENATIQCSLTLNSKEQNAINISSISNFGAKCGVETIMYNPTNTWMNVKDGDYVYSPMRFEIEPEGQKEKLTKLLDQKEDEYPAYHHMTLVLQSNQGNTPFLKIDLRHALIRSVEFANVKASESAKYIVEILPRSMRINGSAFESKNVTNSYENFMMGVSSEKVVLESGLIPGQIKTTGGHLKWKSSFLVVKPTFLANSVSLNFTPIDKKTSENDVIDRLPNSYMSSIVEQDYDAVPRNQTRVPKTKIKIPGTSTEGWTGGDQKLNLEFYVYTAATVPVKMETVSMHEKLDNFLLFLLYGDVSLLDKTKGELDPKPDKEKRLPKIWEESKLLERKRYFVEIYTPASSGFILAIENCSYVADRFDARGKATRYRVQIVGVAVGMSSGVKT